MKNVLSEFINKVKSTSVKVGEIPSPIPLPVFVHAVLVALLTLAPTAFLVSRLEEKVDTINTGVMLVRNQQELDALEEATVSAEPSPSPSPSARATVKPKAVSTDSGETK